MRSKITQEMQEKILTFSISGIIIVAFYLLIYNIDPIYDFIDGLIKVITPFILGFALSFLLGVLCNKIEYGLFKKLSLSNGTKRKLSVTLTVFIFIVVCLSFVVLVGSQVINSIRIFIDNYAVSIAESSVYFSELLSEVEVINDIYNWANDYITENIENAVNIFTEQVPVVLDYSLNFMTNFVNFFIALIVAVYIMLDKERFYRNVKQLVYAVFNKKHADWLQELAATSSTMFRMFVVGKSIDSLIIGILCYIGMTLLRIDFALLISFIVGVTNMIPFFGPFIGAIPGLIILLITSPQESLIFAIWILALQQFDGNILGPKILGNSMGLPALWVMFAIIVGGSLFGIVGMFLGVPVFSIIYILVKKDIKKRLQQKKITVD